MRVCVNVSVYVSFYNYYNVDGFMICIFKDLGIHYYE